MVVNVSVAAGTLVTLVQTHSQALGSKPPRDSRVPRLHAFHPGTGAVSSPRPLAFLDLEMDEIVIERAKRRLLSMLLLLPFYSHLRLLVSEFPRP